MQNINNLIKTEIKFTVLDSSGNVVKTTTEKNEIINEGASVIARLLVDNSSPRPSHLYARFATSQSDAQGASNLGLNNQVVNVTDFIPTDNNSGCLREPIFSTAKVEANDNIVDGKITFFFRLSSVSTLAGTFNEGSSKIYYLGLAAARSIDDYSQDLMFSLLTPGAPIDIPIGGQISVDYTLNLGT